MKLLHVDASPKGNRSNSRELSRYFVEQLRSRLPALSVDHLDLAVETPPHVTGLFAAATYTSPERRTPEMAAELACSDGLCARLLSADALLFAMPMHNWSMPSTFKAFIDNIVRAGLTYRALDDGSFEGLLFGRPTLFLTTRGADLSRGSPLEAMDALTPALRAAFGFIGVATPDFVDAQPLQFAAPADRSAALSSARKALADLAECWATNANGTEVSPDLGPVDQPASSYAQGTEQAERIHAGQST